MDDWQRHQMHGPDDPRVAWFLIGLLIFAWVIFPLVWGR